jgi:ADP-heptose:LPS heptosyltransferase
MAGLDVVVSVQTAAVHMAGALGVDCLAMLPNYPEWRYTANSPTMPWYACVELHRQPAPGAWDPVLDEVTEALKLRLRRRSA